MQLQRHEFDVSDSNGQGGGSPLSPFTYHIKLKLNKIRKKIYLTACNLNLPQSSSRSPGISIITLTMQTLFF